MFNTKRLLVLAHTYHSFVKDQVEALASHFAEITVLVRYKPIAEIANWLPIHALKPHTKAAAIDLWNKPENVRVIPVPLFYLPTDRGYKKLGAQHFAAVKRIIERESIQFDFIHAHFVWSAGHVGAGLKEVFAKPVIVTAYRYGVTELPFKDVEWRTKIESVLNTVDHVITISQSNKSCIDQLDVRTPIHLIPIGHSTDIFYPQDMVECRRTLQLPLDKKILVTVGFLAEKKGQKYLIDAVARLAENREDIFAVIVGSGQLHNKLEQQVRNLGLGDYVRLVGGKPHNEIPIWMNAADLFVLPSLTESFGVVQIEAMACGKPVVATINGGSEEVITSEEYGYLVESGNPKLLATKIEQALEREWNQEQILNYSEMFTWHSIADQILQVYHTALTT